MAYFIVCLSAFGFAYTLNMLYTSVFFHRGLTHRAFKFRRGVKRFIVETGNWVTGIDPKTWVCMHRRHHLYSDTPLDPHSPIHRGFFKLIFVQLQSYGKTMEGLRSGDKGFTGLVTDLKFPISWLNEKGLWFLPHLSQTIIAVVFGAVTGLWALSACLWAGLMSHPIQGWMVNAFGHRLGYRNHETPDKSTNNLFVAWFVMGEGFQNNHHFSPTSVRFSEKWWEVDMGYQLCRLARAMGLIDFRDPIPVVQRQPARIRKAG